MSQTEPHASRVRVAHLTGATISDAPQCCVGCTWWQQRPGGRPPEKKRWMEDVQEQFGPWGKLYLDGGRLIAFLQYGPSAAFERARDLPAGPASADAVLITCSFLVEVGSPWALQSLVPGMHRRGPRRRPRRDRGVRLPLRGGRGVRRALPAPPDGIPARLPQRLRLPHLRTSGRIELMRLELGGIVPVADDQTALEKAWTAVQTWRTAGSPAAAG